MKRIIILGAVVAGLAIPAVPVFAAAAISWQTGLQQDLAHGGGCRKSSPPGQCCHMDRKRGKVHCH